MIAFSWQAGRPRPSNRPPGAAALTMTTAIAIGCAGVAMANSLTPKPIALLEETEPPSAARTPEFFNPTGHGIRGADRYGAGAFGASRAGGARRHQGADFIAEPGAVVHAPISGVVERIGFAYRGDTRYRYVELTDRSEARSARVLYVGPTVMLGAVVRAGDPIGRAQDLGARYRRGITNHVHVELQQAGMFMDPAEIIPLGADRREAS